MLLKELSPSNFTSLAKSALGSSAGEEDSSREGGTKGNDTPSSPAMFRPPSAKIKGLIKHLCLSVKYKLLFKTPNSIVQYKSY